LSISAAALSHALRGPTVEARVQLATTCARVERNGNLHPACRGEMLASLPAQAPPERGVHINYNVCAAAPVGTGGLSGELAMRRNLSTLTLQFRVAPTQLVAP
jgi:hypothetical protein